MSYAITSAQFAGKIKSIKSSAANLRDQVQEALVAATFICIKDNNNATPFQQILDAVGTAAHRQGITQWAETFAPVLLRDNRFKGNKTAFSSIDREGVLADFDAYIAETGMNDVKWYDIAKSKNTTESVFDADKSLESLFKRLEKNELPGLAAALRKAADEYSAQTTAAIREAMTHV